MPGRYKMSDKKHIDRLFQEKFKDFEATPNEAVWKNISAKLQEKEVRRPIVAPIWSRVAGIAAVFALIFFIGEWMFPVSRATLVASEDLEESYENPEFSITDNTSSEASVPAEESKPTTIAKKKIARNISEDLSDTKVIKLKNPEKKEVISPSEKSVASTTPVKAATEKTIPNKKSLLEAIKEPETEIAETSSKGNFEVSTHAAPIYYGNFGSGNFLGSQFNSNSKESEITYSYGINIAYNISDKVKIRSGVNKVSMSYNTNDIAYSAIVGPSAINAIAFNEDTGVEVSPKKGISTKQPVSTTAKETIGRMNSGLLNQKMGFIEVPVELEYNLIDKRFGLNLIGGASTLFLDENKVSVTGGNISASGKANNLNQVSFSTNIGLGLDYNLSEKFKLNMEPMLKYQFNTFNSSSSGNQPFYLGIYSGFSFKF